MRQRKILYYTHRDIKEVPLSCWHINRDVFFFYIKEPNPHHLHQLRVFSVCASEERRYPPRLNLQCRLFPFLLQKLDPFL